MECPPATPVAEGPHWVMNGARTDRGRPMTGLIIKKSMASTEK